MGNCPPHSLRMKNKGSLPELSESDSNMKTKLGERTIKQEWNSVIENIVICQCLSGQLFALALIRSGK